MNKADLRKEFKKMRKAAGSQKELAIMLGLSCSYVCDLEKGRKDFSDRVLELMGIETSYEYKKKQRN